MLATTKVSVEESEVLTGLSLLLQEYSPRTKTNARVVREIEMILLLIIFPSLKKIKKILFLRTMIYYGKMKFQ